MSQCSSVKTTDDKPAADVVDKKRPRFYEIAASGLGSAGDQWARPDFRVPREAIVV